MGDGAKDYHEQEWEDERQVELDARILRNEKRRKTLSSICEDISKIDVRSEEYENIMFLIENKDKIIRNKQLIEVLG